MKVWCGPYAIASFTGMKPEKAQAYCEKVLKRKVTSMWGSEVQQVLRKLGYRTIMRWPKPQPLWRMCRWDRKAIVLVTKHFVVIDGLMISDTKHTVLSGEHWARRKRVLFYLEEV